MLIPIILWQALKRYFSNLYILLKFLHSTYRCSPSFIRECIKLCANHEDTPTENVLWTLFQKDEEAAVPALQRLRGAVGDVMVCMRSQPLLEGVTRQFLIAFPLYF